MRNHSTNNNKLFWLLNLSGWLIYNIVGVAVYGLMQGTVNKDSLYFQIISFILDIVFSYFLRIYIKRKNFLQQLFAIKTIVQLLFATLIIAVTIKFIISLYMMYGLHMYNWQQYSIKVLAVSSFQSWIGFIGWTLCYFVIKIFQRNRQAELEKWQLETALKEAELLSLKAQLNPHFIFNCLNNIRAIAIDDGEKTRQMITYLSEILKSTFKFNQKKLIPIHQEMAYIKNYLLLESIQLEERLSYEISCKKATENSQIPPMSIQLLVENAIKHGIMLLENGGKIEVTIFIKNNELNIQVLNDGQLNPQKNAGIGLENLQKRLKLSLSNTIKFRLEQHPDNKVMAEIKIKL